MLESKVAKLFLCCVLLDFSLESLLKNSKVALVAELGRASGRLMCHQSVRFLIVWGAKLLNQHLCLIFSEFSLKFVKS